MAPASGKAGDVYAGKVRIRACGILEQENQILLLQIQSPVTGELIWIPPGGGVELGESLEETICREFEEEAGLEVSVEQLLHINEVITPPFHAVELFYRVRKLSGKLVMGIDPEHPADEQLIRDIGFFPEGEIQHMDVRPEFLSSAYWKKNTE